MSDITELEQRLAAALERISTGAEALNAQAAPPTDSPDDGAADSAELEKLRQALDEEKTANAQLEERVRVIHGKLEGQVAGMDDEVARLREQAAAAEADITRLRTVNAELRRINNDLRAANAEGVGDAHLINKSMLAELDALRALRDSDQQEVDEVIAELMPLVQEEKNA